MNTKMNNKNLNLAIILLIMSTNILAACINGDGITSTAPDRYYTDNGDGTITDGTTGLMWQKCTYNFTGEMCDEWIYNSIGTLPLATAFDEAANSDIGGYTDWRVPNVKELRSLVEQRCADPSINTTFFPNTGVFYYHTSTINLDDDRLMYTVGFFKGWIFTSFRTSNRYVRFVRDIN